MKKQFPDFFRCLDFFQLLHSILLVKKGPELSIVVQPFYNGPFRFKPFQKWPRVVQNGPNDPKWTKMVLTVQNLKFQEGAFSGTIVAVSIRRHCLKGEAIPINAMEKRQNRSNICL